VRKDAAPMHVLIADDHQVIRKSISSILQSRKDIRVCGEAANGKEAVSKAQLLKPDLLILDISLPDSNGLEVATAIKKLLPEVPILLLSAYAGKQLSEEMKRRGFQRFIFKARCCNHSHRRCRCDCQFEAELLFLASVPLGKRR
jgi:two-component system invasion response regulator UvrY